MDDLKNTNLKDQIKTHAEMLLNLYGVEEIKIKESPSGLNVFVDEILALFDRFPDVGKTLGTKSLPNDYLKEYGRTVHKGGGR